MPDAIKSLLAHTRSLATELGWPGRIGEVTRSFVAEIRLQATSGPRWMGFAADSAGQPRRRNGAEIVLRCAGFSCHGRLSDAERDRRM